MTGSTASASHRHNNVNGRSGIRPGMRRILFSHPCPTAASRRGNAMISTLAATRISTVARAAAVAAIIGAACIAGTRRGSCSRLVDDGTGLTKHRCPAPRLWLNTVAVLRLSWIIIIHDGRRVCYATSGCGAGGGSCPPSTVHAITGLADAFDVTVVARTAAPQLAGLTAVSRNSQQTADPFSHLVVEPGAVGLHPTTQCVTPPWTTADAARAASVTCDANESV